jgi:hypothetical protein
MHKTFETIRILVLYRKSIYRLFLYGMDLLHSSETEQPIYSSLGGSAGGIYVQLKHLVTRRHTADVLHRGI